MARNSFKVSTRIRRGDLQQIADANEEFLGETEVKVQKILERTADIIYKDAKKNVPVDTGYLKSTINKHVERMFVAVTVGAEYAPDVEFETVKSPANRFFRNAIRKGERFLRNQLTHLEV